MNGVSCAALAVAIGMSAIGCGSPTSPSERSSRSTVAAPVPIAPQSGGLIGDLDQPITLTAQNPTPPSATAITLTFEVSSDVLFGKRLASQSVQASGERTSVTLDPLPANATYYWRVWAGAGDAIQTIPTVTSFRIGPAIASGQYRLTIDASGVGCGALFAQPIVVDASLIRTGRAISFSRPGNVWCGGFGGHDCGGISGTFARSSFAGHMGMQRAVATIPANAELDADLQTSGAANPDGTVSGLAGSPFTSLAMLFPFSITGRNPGEDNFCRGSIPWTLAPAVAGP